MENKQFIKKITELVQSTIKYNAKLSDAVYKNFVILLTSDECKEFKKILYYDIQQIDEIDILNKNLLKCLNYIQDDQLDLNILINKFCESELYGEKIQKILNDDVDFLIKMVKLDKNVFKQLIDKDDNYYVNLMRFVSLADVVKIFKSMPYQTNTICRISIEKNCDVIKYVKEQTEDLCKIALIKGHTNLSDINPKYHTERVCHNYIKANKSNLSCITYESNVSEIALLKVFNDDVQLFKLIKDDLCKTPKICEYVVSKDGLLIEYVPVYLQTLRIIEKAQKQNPISKYYVAYECKYDFDQTVIENKFKSELVSIGITDVDFVINKKSKYIIHVTKQKHEVYMMTPINYINFKCRYALENNGYKEDKIYDIIALDVLDNLYNKDYKQTFRYNLKNNKTETVSMFVDEHHNQFVIVYINN